MTSFRMTEYFGGSKITYVPKPNGWIDAFVDGEQKALISGDDVNLVRRTTFARIRREAQA